jgi:DNA-binding transcriptional LysR family regulator
VITRLTRSPAPARPAPEPGATFRTRLRLKHLELFRLVCEHQSLRKAAEAASITQPGATKLVQELEEMFGIALFERDRRGMRLTPPGEIVRRHIDVLMADVRNMALDVDLFATGSTGRLRVGIIPSLSSALLAGAVNGLLALRPLVRLELSEGSTDQLLEQLGRNELDVLFGRVLRAEHEAGLRVSRVYTESFDVVCGRRHPLAARKSVGWKELAQEHWVLPATGPLREMAEDLFTARGVLRPVVAVASSSFHQMRYVIAAGTLLGMLPRSLAQRGAAERSLVILRVEQKATFAPISLIARKDFEQPPLVREFERIVMATAAQLQLS